MPKNIHREPQQYSLEPYQPGEEESIVQYFNNFFGRHRSVGQWKWKYLSNPYTNIIFTAKDENKNIVGYFASTIFDGVYRGQDTNLCNVIEFGRDNKYSNTDFLKNTYKYISHNYETLFYGFPERQTIGMYKKYPSEHFVQDMLLKKQDKLMHQINILNIFKLSKKKLILAKGDVDYKVNELWEEKKHELDMSVKRDWNFIKWRILNNPNKIKLFLIEHESKTIGYVALEKRQSICYIIDFLILDKFMDNDIIKLVDKKALLNLHCTQIRIMISDHYLEKIFRKNNYKTFSRANFLLASLKPNEKTDVSESKFYFTYADGADGDHFK